MKIKIKNRKLLISLLSILILLTATIVVGLYLTRVRVGDLAGIISEPDVIIVKEAQLDLGNLMTNSVFGSSDTFIVNTTGDVTISRFGVYAPVGSGLTEYCLLDWFSSFYVIMTVNEISIDMPLIISGVFQNDSWDRDYLLIGHRLTYELNISLSAGSHIIDITVHGRIISELDPDFPVNVIGLEFSLDFT